MRKQLRSGTTLTISFVFLIVQQQSAKASIFGEENAALSAIQMNTLFTSIYSADMVQNMTAFIKTANESLSIARNTYDTAKMISELDLDTLRRKSLNILIDEFPEIRGLSNEINIFKGEVDSISDKTFFHNFGPHDAKIRELLKRQFKHQMNSSIVAMMYPGIDVEKLVMTENDNLVLKAFKESGMSAKRAWQQTAMSVVAQSVTQLYQDAQKKDSIETQLAAQQAVAATETMRSTQNVSDHMDNELAQKQAEKEEERATRRLIIDELKAKDKNIFKPNF